MTSEAAYFPDGVLRSRETGRSTQRLAETSPEGLGPSIAIAAEISDEQLLEQVREGSQEALVPLFRRYAHAVRSVACRILRNEAEADDLVQEVFLFVFRKAALFDVSLGTARSWIIQVTYHRAIDRRRYLLSRRYYTFADVDASAEEPPDQRRAIPSWETSLDGIWG
jgi:RNA polymerase sigma-70 factor, ECF subfamily